MSTLEQSMDFEMMCPALKKAEPAKSITTVRMRQHYRKNHERIRAHKLLIDVAHRGRCVEPKTLEKLSVTRQQIIEAWMAWWKDYKTKQHAHEKRKQK